MQHASGALRAPATPRQPIRGQRRHAGAVQQGDRRPSDACTQRRHPYLPPMVRVRYISLLTQGGQRRRGGRFWAWFRFLSQLL